MSQPTYMSLDTAAHLLSCSRRTIENMIKRNELRSVKIGPRRLVNAPDVRERAKYVPVAA